MGCKCDVLYATQRFPFRSSIDLPSEKVAEYSHERDSSLILPLSQEAALDYLPKETVRVLAPRQTCYWRSLAPTHRDQKTAVFGPFSTTAFAQHLLIASDGRRPRKR